MKTIICKCCGKEFKSTQNAQKFCCVECRVEYSKQQARSKYETYNCNWCGDSFLSIRRKKYCCKECRLYANGRLVTRKKVKKTPALSIEQIAILSREAGLSYGQYVQKYNLRGGL